MEDKNFADLEALVGAALPKIVEHPEMPLSFCVKASLVNGKCNRCLLCVTACADGWFQAITGTKGEMVTIDGEKCDGCGLCMMVCPLGDITMTPRLVPVS